MSWTLEMQRDYPFWQSRHCHLSLHNPFLLVLVFYEPLLRYPHFNMSSGRKSPLLSFTLTEMLNSTAQSTNPSTNATLPDDDLEASRKRWYHYLPLCGMSAIQLFLLFILNTYIQVQSSWSLHLNLLGFGFLSTSIYKHCIDLDYLSSIFWFLTFWCLWCSRLFLCASLGTLVHWLFPRFQNAWPEKEKK